jgi:DNA-binding response OmpR family regulator
MVPIDLIVLVGGVRKAAGQIVELLPNETVIVTAATPEAARSLLRQFTDRAASDDRMPLRVGDLLVDLAGRRVRCRDIELNLTPQEFDLLTTLAAKPGRAVPFNELIARAWGIEDRAEVDMLRSAVKRLRRKLALAGVGVPIEAVRGYGFRLDTAMGPRAT